MARPLGLGHLGRLPGRSFGIGAALALTTTGLPLNANGDREGGPFAWFNGYAVLGGLAVVEFSSCTRLAFLALKTDGDVRHRARRWFVRLLPVLCCRWPAGR